MKFSIAILLVGLGYFTITVGPKAYQNYQGICADTGTRLSELEIVEIASRYVDATDKSRLVFLQENQILGYSEIPIPAGETSDPEHRLCCSIAPWDTLRHEEQEIVKPVLRMYGRFRAWVNLTYKLPDGTYRAQLLPIGNCGEFPSRLID